MAKNGFNIKDDLKKFERHRQDVKRAEIRVAKGAAKQAADNIVEAAPEETGAMKEAVYTINREYNGQITSGYEEHIVDAAAKNDRIGVRGQREEELTPPSDGRPGDAKAWAAVHIPVNYADILIDGFPHVKGGYEVPPNDFFNPAIEPVNAAYEGQAQQTLDAELKKLEKS